MPSARSEDIRRQVRELVEAELRERGIYYNLLRSAHEKLPLILEFVSDVFLNCAGCKKFGGDLAKLKRCAWLNAFSMLYAQFYLAMHIFTDFVDTRFGRDPRPADAIAVATLFANSQAEGFVLTAPKGRSMEPAIEEGDLVVGFLGNWLLKLPPLKVGDVVSLVLPTCKEGVLMIPVHRVVDFFELGGCELVVTKGDASEEVDKALIPYCFTISKAFVLKKGTEEWKLAKRFIEMLDEVVAREAR